LFTSQDVETALQARKRKKKPLRNFRNSVNGVPTPCCDHTTL